MLNAKNVDFVSNFHGVEKMKSGYEEMGILNLTLSEEGLTQDMEDLKRYEKKIVESE